MVELANQTITLLGVTHAYAPGDVSWGQAESSQIDTNAEGFVYQTAISAKTCTLKLRGIRNFHADGLVELAKGNRSQLLNGAATGADLVIDGRLLRQAILDLAEPEGLNEFPGVGVYNAVALRFRSLVQD